MAAHGNDQNRSRRIPAQTQRSSQTRPADRAHGQIEDGGTSSGARPAVDPHDEVLAVWAEQLRLAMEDLRQREQQALTHELTPPDLLALTAERDKIGLDRDSIATAFSEPATGRRDQAGLGRDVAGSLRDRHARAVAQDRDARELAAGDRDTAAADRERAGETATEQDRVVHGLRAAWQSRVIIARAEGLLMARYNMSVDDAFGILVRLAQDANVKLRDVAAKIVAASEAERA